MKLEKMGMRTIKTGIAVAVCVWLGSYIVQDIFFSAIACVISMQDTVKGSVKAGFNRVKGTVIGGIVGFIITMISPGNPILCGLGVSIVIYICNNFKLNSSIVVSCVTFLSIYLSVIEGDPAMYSITRTIDTSIGVVFGVIINYALARPNYLHTITEELKRAERIANNIIKNKIILKDKVNIERLNNQINRIEKIYNKLIEELNYSRDEVETNQLEEALNLCKEIYFHLQSIELLEKKLYLTQENYNSIKSIYNLKALEWEIDEEESPVFNYHLKKVIDELTELKRINDEIK